MENEEKFRSIFEQAAVGIARVAPDGSWLEVNQRLCDIVGYSKAELLTRTFQDITHPDDLDTDLEYVRQILTGKLRTYSMKKRYFRNDGDIVWINLTVSLVRHENGEPKYFISVVEDISEQKKAEKELYAANQQLAASNQQLMATEQQLRAYNEQLKATNQQLKVTEQKLQVKNRLAEIFLLVTDDGMYLEVLSVVLGALQSEFGVFGYLDEKGDLIVPSMTRHIWDRCNIPEKDIVFPRERWGCSSWPRAIKERKSNYTNDPSSLVPEGHIPIRRHITVPIIHRENVVGLFQVANKSKDYTKEDVLFLEEISNVVGPILDARLQRDWFENKRRQAESALKESQERINLLLDSTAEGIYGIDIQGLCTFHNAACLRLLGYEENESLIGKNMHDLIHHTRPNGSPYPEKKCPIYKAFLNREGVHVDNEILWKKDGSSFPAEYWSYPVIKGEDLVGLAVTFIDVSERKDAEKEHERLQAQFSQAQKMESVGRLAGGVAHDFNNMLSIILGYTDIILKQFKEKDPLHGFLIQIREAAQRSAALTRQLLAFARRQPIAPLVLNLNETIEAMLKMLRRLIGEDINLAWLPSADLGLVKMDPGQLDQILANLCVNARDAISGVGNITIETHNVTLDESYCIQNLGFSPGSYVMLAVSDNGCGMDKETTNKLFEPFFTTKKEGKGTGLGLATVYGIVKQNNGFINVYSEPGKGSSFKIYFPRHDTEEKPDRIKAASIAQGGSETILLVEDEEMILNLEKIMLESLGYRVLAAKRPSDAIHLAEDHSGEIDLLITDVVMPEMNGRELTTKLQTIKPGLNVLFMSGYTSNVIAHHGVLEEGVIFLQKPFSINELANKVRDAIVKP